MNTETKAVARQPETNLTETNPATLLELAVKQNLDIDKLEKLLALQERWEAKQSRKLFFESLSIFQGNCPEIIKNKKVNYALKTGGYIKYDYASLDQIISDIKKPLEAVGLSYRWEFGEEAGLIFVTCIVTHKSGHSESNKFSAKADTSGQKNDVQQKASTITYLQRYTLTGALGISTANADIDGSETKVKPEGKAVAEIPDEIIEQIEKFEDEKELRKFGNTQTKWNKRADFRLIVNTKIAALKSMEVVNA